MSLVAFTVSGMRPTPLPTIPGLIKAHQINVRAYVHRDGVPGLCLFSLDANNPPAVRAARLGYRLAFHARMHVGEDAGVVAFRSERTDANAPKATFDAVWQVGDALPICQPGTLDFFLLERYVLYSGTNDHLLRTRIHHRPWPPRSVTSWPLSSTMLAAQRLPRQTDAPLTRAQAAPLDVAMWQPRHPFP